MRFWGPDPDSNPALFLSLSFSFEIAFEKATETVFRCKDRPPKQTVAYFLWLPNKLPQTCWLKTTEFILLSSESGNPIINQNIRGSHSLFFFKLFFLLLLSIYFRWHCFSVAVLRLSLVPASGALLLRCLGFSSGSTGSIHDSAVVALGLSHLRHVEFSWTRD